MNAHHEAGANGPQTGHKNLFFLQIGLSADRSHRTATGHARNQEESGAFLKKSAQKTFVSIGFAMIRALAETLISG